MHIPRAFGLTKHGEESYVVYSMGKEYIIFVVIDDDIMMTSPTTLNATEAKAMHKEYLKQGWQPMKKDDVESVLGMDVEHVGPPRGSLHWTSKLTMLVGAIAMVVVC